MQRGQGDGQRVVALLYQSLQHLPRGLRLGHALLQGFLQLGQEPLLPHAGDVFGRREFPKRNALPHPALDALPQASLARGDQRPGHAGVAGACGASHPVNVDLGVSGQVVVDDMRNLGDVEPARGHIGGHQQAHMPAAHRGEHVFTRGLAHVAVQGRGRPAVVVEGLGHFAGAHPRAAENQAGLHRVPGQKAGQRRQFVSAVHAKGFVPNAARGGFLRLDGDVLGRAHVAGGQVTDGTRQRGREQRGLAGGRRGFQQRGNVFDKAHAEHLVGFIQHDPTHLVQLQGPPVQQVQQAARRADHHRGPAAAQGPQLGAVTLAAVYGHDGQIQPPRVIAQALGDLQGQFAGGRDNQGLHMGGVRVQGLQHGQAKGRGLAGAGLRAAQHIVPGQQGRNGLDLDGGGLGVAQGGQVLHQTRVQPQRHKGVGHGKGSFLGHREPRPSPACAGRKPKRADRAGRPQRR